MQVGDYSKKRTQKTAVKGQRYGFYGCIYKRILKFDKSKNNGKIKTIEGLICLLVLVQGYNYCGLSSFNILLLEDAFFM